MAAYLSNELSGTVTGTATTVPVGYKPAATVYGARVKAFRATVTYATQTTSDTITLFTLPTGVTFLRGTAFTSVTTATATIAIGITGTAAKYRAAAAITTVDAPQDFGLTAIAGAVAPSTAEETVFITIGTASLPAAGTLVVEFLVSAAN
jgi:hypothetical protein